MNFPWVFLLLVSQHLKEVRTLSLQCRGFQIVYKTTNLECFPNPKYLENSSCVVKAINWNKSVAQMDSDLKLTLRNVSVHMEAFKKGYNNRYHPFLINSEFNFCDIISKKNFLAYGKILYKVMKPFTNVNHSCPYTGHIMARNLYIDESVLPIFPLGFYLFSVKFIENYPQQASEIVGVAKFYCEVKELVEKRTIPKI